MRAVLCDRWGGPETLRVGEVEAPTVGARELLIAPKAWGVNFADLVLIAGDYYLKPPFPFIPGMEIAGHLIAVGEEVASFSLGDEVAAYVECGGYAEQVVATPEATMKVPRGMPLDVAAAFPATYGTAYVALLHRARLQPCETVLVLGAAGGVGLAAVEIARRLGATVIAAAGSKEKIEVASERGAHHVVDYSTDEIFERVMEITGEAGVDVVFDPVGGELFERAFRCLAFEGRLIVIGFTSGTIPSVRATRVLVKPRSLIGSSWTATLKRRPDIIRQAFTDLTVWYQDGDLHPKVGTLMPFERAPDALTQLARRAAIGRIVLT